MSEQNNAFPGENSIFRGEDNTIISKNYCYIFIKKIKIDNPAKSLDKKNIHKYL